MLSALRQCFPPSEHWQRGWRRGWTAKKWGNDLAGEDNICGEESNPYHSQLQAGAGRQPPACFWGCSCAFASAIWAPVFYSLVLFTALHLSRFHLILIQQTNYSFSDPRKCPSDFPVWKRTVGQWSTGLIYAEHRSPCSMVLGSKLSQCACFTQYRSFSYVFQQSLHFAVLLLLETLGNIMDFAHLSVC